MTWESFYDVLHIKEFIYFISSPQLQETLLPVKMVFILCAFIFLLLVIHFMLNSSWLQHKFLEEVTEFFSWKARGQREISKQWGKIKKRIESGAESDYKLAIIDADDFLAEVLDSEGYDGDSFEETIKKAGKMIDSILDDVLAAHETRNSIVYNPDFKISADQAQKVLSTYESAIKNIGIP